MRSLAHPTGQTTAAKVKVLLACLEARLGRARADAWLEAQRLTREDLEDETRLLPLSAYKKALEAFERELPEGLAETADFMVQPESLGPWARLLRGTRAPEQAFARLDGTESEHGRTVLWETEEAAPGRWRGRVRLAHDPALEADGLLARARAVEVSVVPMLFGYPRGAVTTDAPKDGVQSFEVRWRTPSIRHAIVRGAVAGGLGGIALLALAGRAPLEIGLAAALPVVCAAGAAFFARDAAARIDRAAHAMRVHALERSLALRDDQARPSEVGLEGTVLAGQYRIGARMGSGASGVIYEATRLSDGLPVAVKLLRAASAHDTVAADRLRREAEALGLSWHPNVVEIKDHGHAPDGTTYLVLELLRGEPLGSYLHARGCLTPEEVQPLATQIAEALVAIHAAGVVHRDLKPGNIFLTPSDEGLRVKILDFGIARVEWEEMRITNMGAPLGTQGYMSPEQEIGGEVDARSDLFALGAVVYECLVGEPPPPLLSELWSPERRSSREADLDSGVHPAARRAASEPPGAVSASVPKPWRAFVEKALARRPDDRFQDARSMLAALRALGNAQTTPGATGAIC